MKNVCVWFRKEIVKREIGKREFEKREISEKYSWFDRLFGIRDREERNVDYFEMYHNTPKWKTLYKN